MKNGFFYGRNEEVVPAGEITRLRANIAALKLLRSLAKEGRSATAEERPVLAAFGGWGGTKAIFDDLHLETFLGKRAGRHVYEGSDYANWEKRFGKVIGDLFDLLGKEDFDAAARASRTSHFTDPRLCHRLWDAAVRMGFKGGVVLEPTVGSGLVIGAMPEALRDKVHVVGVELDPTTHAIATNLFPEADIRLGDFLRESIPSGYADLVIGNVPFDEIAPAGQSLPGAPKMNLHNYMIGHAMSRAKPGALGVLITSASTMQSNTEQRAWLAANMELMGAVRLPAGAHKLVNTEVVTDILALRRPDGVAVASHPWAGTVSVIVDKDLSAKDNYGKVLADATQVNEYFNSNPGMVIGRHAMDGRLHGRMDGQYSVRFDGADFSPALDRAVASLPADVPNVTTAADVNELIAAGERRTAQRFLNGKTGSIVLTDTVQPWGNRLAKLGFGFDGPVALPPPWLVYGDDGDDGERTYVSAKLPRGWTRERVERLAVDFVGLRTSAKNLIAHDLLAPEGDPESDKLRAELAERYRAFVKEWGRPNDPKVLPLDRLFPMDPEMGVVMALEVVKTRFEGGQEIRTYLDAPILSKRTIAPAGKLPPAQSLEEAVARVLNRDGAIRADAVAKELDREINAEEMVRQLTADGIVFLNPANGLMESRAKYLSGDISTKLAIAERAAEANPDYLRNVDALRSVKPTQLSVDQVKPRFGAPWVPGTAYERFAAELIGWRGSFHYIHKLDRWMPTVEKQYGLKNAESWSTSRVPAEEIFIASLNGQTVKVYDTVDGTKYINRKESERAHALIERVKATWDSWILTQDDVRAELVERFNRDVNRFVAPEYDGSRLTLPTMAKGPGLLVPKQHQLDVTARIIEEQAGLIAHDVGYGKTLSCCMSAMESVRLKLVRKAMVVCDNASYMQFARTLQDHFPAANILVASPDAMSRANRTAFLAMAATGDWDCVVMARSQFELIPVKQETTERFYAKAIDDLRQSIREMRERGLDKAASHQNRMMQGRLERDRQKLREKFERQKERADDCLCFEDLGVDGIWIDEAHNFKRIGFASAMEPVKGIDGNSSQRGDALLIKAQWLHERRDGKGVVLATATPVTNTMAEVWNMMRLCNPNALRAAGVERFDAFRRTFCEEVTAVEMDEASGRWKMETRLARFVNAIPFIALVRSSFDVKNDPKKAGLVLPDLMGGKMHAVVTPLTPAADLIINRLQQIYANYEKLKETNPGLVREKYGHVPIMLLQTNMTAAIDPRLIDATAGDDPGSPVNRCVELVTKIHFGTASERRTQLVFCDRRRTMSTAALRDLMDGGIEGMDPGPAPDSTESIPTPSDKTAEEEQGEENDPTKRIDGTESVAGDGRFDLYRDLVEKLVARGIPREEIAIVQDCKDKVAAAKLFSLVNEGVVRVLIGSTAKMGVGVNVQEKLIALHHVDPPRSLTPADLTQRNGRIVRHGNANPNVAIYAYGMMDTATAAIYHRIQRKDMYCRQSLAGNGGNEFEDCGDVNLEEVKACMVSDGRVARRAELKKELSEERMSEDLHSSTFRRIQTSLGEVSSSVKRRREFTLPNLDAKLKWLGDGKVAPVVWDRQADKKGPPVAFLLEVSPGSKRHDLDDLKFNGPAAEFHDKLSEYFKSWKNGRFATFDQLAIGTFNGVRFKLHCRTESAGFDGQAGLFRNGVEIQFMDPSGAMLGAGSKSIMGGGSLITAFNEVISSIPQERESVSKSIDADVVRLAELQQKVDSYPPFNSGRIREIEGELDAIEADLRENPTRRRVASRLDRFRNRSADMPVPGGVAAVPKTKAFIPVVRTSPGGPGVTPAGA